jgi:Flp pilus assembly protein TadD
MLSECPQCGQKLRPQWVRCPRCRSLLSESGPATAPALNDAQGAVAPKSPAKWGMVAAGAVVLVVLGLVVTRDDTPAASASAVSPQVITASRPTNESAAGAATESKENSAPVPSTTFVALDSRRAAGTAYAQGDFAAALAALEAAVDAAPADPEARNNLGQLLVRQGRAADALPHFDEAVRLMPSKWDYRFNRARAYGLVDRWTEAVAEYRVAAQLFPDDHATLYNLGLAQLRTRDYAGAATSLEQAVAQAPDEHEFLITLGTAYVGAAEPDRARATFEKFLQVAPQNAEVPKVKALLQALADSAP